MFLFVKNTIIDSDTQKYERENNRLIKHTHMHSETHKHKPKNKKAQYAYKPSRDNPSGKNLKKKHS